MNNLFSDIGYVSINHYNEELCGDHIEVLNNKENNYEIIVLADGLGSGVKANILSILTSKIISTMLCEGLNLEECVKTIIDTLPVCKERKVAYSTFTIIRIQNNEKAEVIQYDNPKTILLRDGKNFELPFYEINISNKEIIKTEIDLKENDILVAFSDGVEHAGESINYNLKWKRSDIIDFLTTFYYVGFNAKTLATILLEETNRLYKNKPLDDASVCAIKIKKRLSVNLCFGPPEIKSDCEKMLNLFFAKEGKHIICGGTTSKIASKYLNKELEPSSNNLDPEIPPISYLCGCDLVTEGLITLKKVLEYANDYLLDNKAFEKWSYKKDGASLVSKMLFEEATDINFFVGKASNAAYINDTNLGFDKKMSIVDELTKALEKMGKNINVSYF
ncbi:MAG: SpoIIE family protein phosphatase [Eubacteriales bacterium]|nr:SpoIIE family protein phosphatase [Eubacteriales bacterium]